MVTHLDRRGLAITVASATAARLFDVTVDSFLGHRADCGAKLAETLAADPEFLLALCLRGFAAKLLARRELDDDARQSLSTARASARARGATSRELAYVAALQAWCDDDMRGAGELLSAVLSRDPLDALAIKLHHAVHFMIGDRRAMLGTLRRALEAWDENVAGFGYVLGCFAFALEEAGAYDRSERLGRRACELNPADIWAIHAVTHVFEMRGEPRAGLRWIAARSAALAGCNNLIFHLAWHRALFHLALDEPRRALLLYDTEIRASESEDYRDIANAASLLWRLEQGGVAVGARWRELADKATAQLGDPSLAFASLHRLLSLLGDDRRTAAETLLCSLRLQAKRRRGTQPAILDAVGIAVAEAVLAAKCGQHGRVVDLLFPIRRRIVLIGGSNAQRDIIAQLLIDAAIRADRRGETLILLRERARARPRDGWAASRSARLGAPSDDRPQGANRPYRNEALIPADGAGGLSPDRPA